MTIAELGNHLPIGSTSDFDYLFASKLRTKQIAAACGLKPGVFWLMHHMFSGVRKVDADASYLLLQHGYPRYRFCPECLKLQRSPHFPLQWRFTAYRWCEQHRRLLSDHCPECHAAIVLPSNLLRNAERGGRGLLHCCGVCDAKLYGRSSSAEPRKPTKTSSLLESERRLIKNGGAVLAALFHRKVIVHGIGTCPLSYLRILELAGQLPHMKFHYEMEEPEGVCFRDPWTDRLRRLNNQSAEEPLEPWSGGLFAG